MNLVNLSRVAVSHTESPLLDGVSLGVADTDRIGVVGTNGAGKTTLLEVLARRRPTHAGRVTHATGLRIGFLSQHDQMPTGPVGRIVLGEAFGVQHQWAGDAGVRAVLDGLGLHEVGLDSPVERLSGGERRRVALAALLVSENSLLVLDEPTNHLDAAGIAWLAAHLSGRTGGLVVVTHDRWFLDAVCLSTLEVTGGQVLAYEGGYSAYVLARAERARRAGAADARRANLLRKELAWLQRGAPARTSKPRFRLDAAAALVADEPAPRDPLALRALATVRLGRSVYDVESVTAVAGDKVLLRDATLRVGPAERVAIVGANGSGKTTLLRLLIGAVTPQAGRVKVGRTVRPAYLSQHLVELPATLRVLEAVEEVARYTRVEDVALSATRLLDQFGFAAERQWTPVGELSGGERRRLQLLRLLVAEPNVLLLDEPTNDLDIDTLTALEDLLDSWPGTVIVVSHDRYLVERVCDRVVALLGDGALLDLPGGIEEYLRRQVAHPPMPSSPARERKGDSRTPRKHLDRLERLVARLSARELALHEQMAQVAADHAQLSTLDTELRSVVAQRLAAEHSWLEAAQ
ncbi:MAG: ATP-binding cassette domain-containing protein [Actinomycetota bacterium]|nr:ATP-binding cassette domain-containing protein [Actinomycetota bacterium]